MTTKPSISREFGNADGIGAVPTAVAGSCVATEYGTGVVRKTRLTFTAFGITLSDTVSPAQGGGTKCYTFPEGRLLVLGAVGSLTFTTTSALASTLNASVTCQWGLGTVVQANTTLATTEQDLLPNTAFTSSATINVANTATTAALAASAQFDGTTTAKAAWLNVAVAGATDIDGNATLAVDGYIDLVWTTVGDF